MEWRNFAKIRESFNGGTARLQYVFELCNAHSKMTFWKVSTMSFTLHIVLQTIYNAQPCNLLKMKHFRSVFPSRTETIKLELNFQK